MDKVNERSSGFAVWHCTYASIPGLFFPTHIPVWCTAVSKTPVTEFNWLLFTMLFCMFVVAIVTLVRSLSFPLNCTQFYFTFFCCIKFYALHTLNGHIESMWFIILWFMLLTCCWFSSSNCCYERLEIYSVVGVLADLFRCWKINNKF